MSYIHYPYQRNTLGERKIKWLIYLFLAFAFFVTAHDSLTVQRSVGDYNLAQEDVVESMQGGNTLRQVALLTLGAAAILSFFTYSTPIRLRPDAVTTGLLVAFVSWCAVSLLWADDRGLAFKRLVAFAIVCLVSLAIVRMFSFAEIVKWIFFFTATCLVISVSLEVGSGAFRPWLSDYRFAGIQHPNDEGIECALLCLAGVAMARLDGKRSRLYWTSAALGALFLFLTRSRTSLIAALLAFGVLKLLSGSKSSKKVIWWGTLAIAACGLMLMGTGLQASVKNPLSLQRDGENSVDSFAGRTDIWLDVEPDILARPFIGHGYMSFWTPAHIEEISHLEQWGVPDGHSAYVDYLLTVGAVGLVLYVLCVGQGLRRVIRMSKSSRKHEAGFLGAILVFGLVDGFFESNIAEVSLLMLVSIIALVWIGVGLDRAANTQPISAGQ